jgi:hypothetical protein
VPPRVFSGRTTSGCVPSAIAVDPRGRRASPERSERGAAAACLDE